MKRIIAIIIVAMLAVCSADFASAASKADAENNVKRAVAFVKANGKDKALAEFSNPKGQFVNGELYVYAVDKKGIIIAHGINPKLLGKNMYDLKDAAGKRFIQDILKAPKNGAWIEYQWAHPVTKKIEHKIAYFEAVNDMYLICGVYK